MKRVGFFFAMVMFAAVPTMAHAISFAAIIEWFTEQKNEVSAWKVETKQAALAGNQEAESLRVSKQALATGIGALGITSRMHRAVVDYGNGTGQPESMLCPSQTNLALQVEAGAQRDRDTQKLMASFASSRVSSRVVAEAERRTAKRANYCTVSEAKQQMCDLSANGMQGWDVNYGAWSNEVTLAPEGEVAAAAYVTTLADARAEAAVDCKSVDCEVAAGQSLQNAAIAGMVAQSIIGQATDRRQPFMTGK